MPRKATPLVCQFLEKASGKVLEKYQSIIREYVYRRPGVYALYKRERLYYVDLAKNLRGRLRGHLHDRHKGKWDRFSIYITIGDEHIKELESLILRMVPTPGNKQIGKFTRADNLLSQLKKKFRSEQRNELKDLFGRRIKELKKLISKSNQINFARYNLGGYRLIGIHRGKTLKTHVKKNGLIPFKNKDYRSPSEAAGKAVGTAKNGWNFWKYERAPEDCVRLATLRK